MPTLSSPLRKQLESVVLAGRRASEAASRAALDGLDVFVDRRPEHLDDEQAALRNGLRAKWRQLGGDRELLVAECGYEQWHRLLFARFLAENRLLLHPEFRAAVTLQDCEELAAGLGEPDGWSVAARFAAEILPGIFRLSDPCGRIRLAPEGRFALEQVITGLPAELFLADDALGWVYQFWQKDKKDEINASERKVGGADLGAVTQLFTENYMVRFLLENSLGAWWASRHPNSPLVQGFDYLRFDEEKKPASGAFAHWPARVADVTIIDPCCGSGHFLVEAFAMLWQMRAEEEALSGVDAQDAVLRDNLFGLELDPRCVQIAMFAVALQAWKVGGGWRRLPLPHIACCGIPVKAPVEEWTKLAKGDTRLENALFRLHVLFRDADTLGSLIDPRRTVELTDPTGVQRSLEDVDWSDVAPILERAVAIEDNPAVTSVLSIDAAGVAQAASYLAATYTLVATNVPYLARRHQDDILATHIEMALPLASPNLATALVERFLYSAPGSTLAAPGSTLAVVSPQNWLYAGSYEAFRRTIMSDCQWAMLAKLGPRAFRQITGEVVDVHLSVIDARPAGSTQGSFGIDAQGGDSVESKELMLKRGRLLQWSQSLALRGPGAIVRLDRAEDLPLLSAYADSRQGLATGDDPRFKLFFWELPGCPQGWIRHQSSVDHAVLYGGCEQIVNYGYLSTHSEGAVLRGLDVWGTKGVSVRQTRPFPCSVFLGMAFDMNAAAVIPHSDSDLEALWAFCNSEEFRSSVVALDPSLKVTNASLLKVPFDVARWREIAALAFPNGLPEPTSHDPNQWLFEGRPKWSSTPLQVAVARLLGYRWPDQPEKDELDRFSDADGIACLPSVAGKAPAAERLQELLAGDYDTAWSPLKLRELLGSAVIKRKNVDDWLRDEFFKQHCMLFGNRPFIWQIWDGLKDGFSALLNYHRLDRRTLEKVTYTYLGQDWVERQRAAVRDEVEGAEARLGAALELQRKLKAILTGDDPYDIYVRWKRPDEQAVGWEPDLSDGVRPNIRPFVEARVLRAPFNIHWKKDRGKDPDGSERRNDVHLSLAEKHDARKKAGLS